MKTLVMIVVVQAVCATVVSSFSFSSPDCPAQAVPGVTLKVPDPNDCSKYSLCMQLFNMKLDCSEGQHFSAAAGKCLPAALAGCDPGKVQWSHSFYVVRICSLTDPLRLLLVEPQRQVAEMLWIEKTINYPANWWPQSCIAGSSLGLLDPPKVAISARR
ncbi:hypothetical protein HPB51_009082 [Rhipicephalus microplus]|uniref:Chitin-binding type-2 domain-containing protein n=1 Tax=Rhipicephalus microplus TaxID=6941 RepID=A0A9J6EZF0_RHIMP|nr:hypothetical protein HPB51_009082 [Rhipicephalus microplus]